MSATIKLSQMNGNNCPITDLRINAKIGEGGMNPHSSQITDRAWLVQLISQEVIANFQTRSTADALTDRQVRIHYRVEGEGPSLVLQHGFLQSIEDWYECSYVDAVKNDYRLVLVDARGHGSSDKPHDPEAYLLDSRVADVVAVLDALAIKKAHFWGYSMRGWIAFGMAKVRARADRSPRNWRTTPIPLRHGRLSRTLASRDRARSRSVSNCS